MSVVQIQNFMKQELSGWKKEELGWMIFSCGVITGVSVYGGDSLMGWISAVTGLMNVLCTGKGKRAAFGFGIINSLLYGLISYEAQLYGETMLNILYYLPMQFVGFYVWSRHMEEETHEVEKRWMQWNGRVCLLVAVAVGTILYGWLLKFLGDAMPFVDAFTTVSSVITLIISVNMYAEQWGMWIVIDAVSIYMWWKNYQVGSENIATLFMWILFLMNGILMLVKWNREKQKDGSGYHTTTELPGRKGNI